MERLTEKLPDGRVILKNHYTVIRSNRIGSFIEGEAVDKLAEYEAAEEQGLLLRLPCKIGDTVWFVCRIYDRTKKDFVRVVHNGYIKAIKFTLRPTKITVEYEDLYDTHGRCNGADFHVTSIGKTVFLTREEAEKALAEMG